MTDHKCETPTSRQASGVSDKQQSFLPTPEFCPIPPPPHSAAAQALADLLDRDITQIDWLETGKGWRLAAAVKELGYLGWEPVSIRVKYSGWGRKIARYSLPAKAKQAAREMRQQGGAHA
ncbi:MAG: hypothetical protein WCH44_06470 [Betaproteobacteria bacterium]